MRKVLFYLILGVMMSCAKPADEVALSSNISSIVLDVYAENDFSHVRQIVMDEAGKIQIGDVSDNITFYVFARCDSFFTAMYKVNSGDFVTIVLDRVPESKFCGTMFITSRKMPSYTQVDMLNDVSVNMEGLGVAAQQIITDRFGRFEMDEMPENSSWFKLDGVADSIVWNRQKYQDIVFEMEY